MYPQQVMFGWVSRQVSCTRFVLTPVCARSSSMTLVQVLTSHDQAHGWDELEPLCTGDLLLDRGLYVCRAYVVSLATFQCPIFFCRIPTVLVRSFQASCRIEQICKQCYAVAPSSVHILWVNYAELLYFRILAKICKANFASQ